MLDIAKHVLIFDKAPTDDFVEKRTIAIEALAESFLQIEQVTEILRLAGDLAAAAAPKGVLLDSRANEVESLIKKQSTAFVREGQDLQILTCALLAAFHLLQKSGSSSGAWSRVDVLACGLWSSLSFQGPRREPRLEVLRAELLECSRNLVLKTSSVARNRESVPDMSIKAADGDTLIPFAEKLNTASNRTISALRTNAALDREELDLLWWVLSDWSTLLSRRMSSLPPAIAAIFSGVEAAELLRRLPGEAHKHLVLRNIGAHGDLNLKELLEQLGDERAIIAAHFRENKILANCPRVFPLLSAILDGNATGAAATAARSLDEWGARALLESAILHVATLRAALV